MEYLQSFLATLIFIYFNFYVLCFYLCFNARLNMIFDFYKQILGVLDIVCFKMDGYLKIKDRFLKICNNIDKNLDNDQRC